MTLSRNRLIDVQFDMALDVGSLDLAASHLWALTSHCGRWQKVQLSMPTLLVNDLNDHILDNVSALTNITLVNVDDGSWDWEADDLPRMHFLENAPLLRHVSVCDFSHSRLVPLYDTHIVAFPFHKSNTQLHSFSVHGGSAWHAVDCLMSQPSLRHLSVLKNDCGMDSLSLPLGPISKHSSLSSISTSSSALLDTVDLPNLRSASLDVASDWMAPNQERLFDSSHAKLEGLTVTDLPLSPHVGFIPMLTGLTSLTSISLKFTRYARQRDTELRYLTECLLEKDFLPRLACVEIGFSYLFYPVPALKALNKGALRRFKLTSSREPLMSEEQQESVKKLVKYGLTTDIRLKSGRL
ncbi:hypothetical protein BDZ89DRAFT_1068836 [Hymenopellis radicata]|nr:hypothetical protein BDZ89DRAFT_1068836 [Hymenopellis radicata]